MYRKQRFLGCMLGLAVGDAFGSTVKNMSVADIKKAYGRKGILKPKPEKGQKLARISDETQLALFTVHGILWAHALGTANNNAAYTPYVFYALEQWLYTQTGGTSSQNMQWVLDDEQTGYPCMLLGIRELCKKRMPTKQLVQTLSSIDDRSYGRLNRSINGNKLFDCVPRVAAAGLYFYSDPSVAFRKGAEFAAITHSDPSAYLAAGCFAAIIAFICRKSTIEDAVRSTIPLLTDYNGCESCYSLLNKALELLDNDSSPMEDVAALGNGSNADSALAIGIYCACVHYEYEDSLRLAVNQDGNSDACAAIAGALKGAYLGARAIPSGWIKKTQLSDVVSEYALDLLSAAPKKLV